MVHLPVSIGHAQFAADTFLDKVLYLNRRSARRPAGRGVKRVMDIVIAAIALIVSLPLFLFIAVAIKLSSGGSVFFRQFRVGYDGQLFRCIKFRTMVPDAEVRLDRYLAANPAAADEWRKARKLTHDPRVTLIGRVLRKSSLDELPQLLNVLWGDMSCVGPRPVVPVELEIYGIHARDYLAVRPGLTGIWQVSGRNSLTYRRRVALDRLYARRWSIKLDIAILVRTLPAIMDSRTS